MPGLCIFASFKPGCGTDNSQSDVKCEILGYAANSVWEDQLGMWSQRKTAAAWNHPSLSCSAPGTGTQRRLWLHGCKSCVGMFRTRFKMPQLGDTNCWTLLCWFGFVHGFLWEHIVLANFIPFQLSISFSCPTALDGPGTIFIHHSQHKSIKML